MADNAHWWLIALVPTIKLVVVEPTLLFIKGALVEISVTYTVNVHDRASFSSSGDSRRAMRSSTVASACWSYVEKNDIRLFFFPAAFLAFGTGGAMLPDAKIIVAEVRRQADMLTAEVCPAASTLSHVFAV